MASTRLQRKARRNKSRAKAKVATIQRLKSKPVIKNVDVEEIKKGFTKGSDKKAEPKAEKAAPKAEKAEPKAEKAEAKAEKAAPNVEKTEKPAAKKSSKKKDTEKEGE